ncbi:MAG: HAD-IIB family hydrolase [Minisyncoccia bacterium]
MNTKKVIVCDLDGTLAQSKSPLGKEMADVLCKLLSKHLLVIVSGGGFEQFQKQFLSQLHCGNEALVNLSIFPANGSSCYVFDKKTNDWKQLYYDSLTDKERKEVVLALKESLSESGIDFSEPYGELIEDRGGQITFSGRGQEAPIEVKEAWDPDQEKRQRLVSIISDKLAEFDIHIGGTTSIDITRKGIDKAYAIRKIKEILNVSDDDIIFIGDALYKGGNDSPVKKTNVDYIQQSGPDETIELLRQYI